MIKISATKDKDLHLLRFFFKYVRPHKKLLFLAGVAIPFSTFATVFIPWLLAEIIDKYIMVGNTKGLYSMTLLLAGTVIIAYLSDSIYAFTLQKVGHHSIASMRKELFSHAFKLPRSYFDNHPLGTILSRLTSDMEAMGETIATGVFSMITDFIKMITLIILLLFLSWRLTAVLLLVFPVVYIVVSIVRGKLRYYFTTARVALADATGYLQESLNGIKTVQLNVAENKVLNQFKGKNKKFLRSQSHANIYDAILFSIIDGLTTVTVALIIWFGTGQIISNIITIGVLIAFINAIGKIFIPIREFAQQITMIQRALAALEHISELFNVKPEEIPKLDSKNLENQLKTFNDLSFDNVSFSYKGKSTLALKNISFSLKKGEKIALVGTTGSGKSTLLRLISKSYSTYQGSIKVNGIELSEIPAVFLNNIITMMHQDVYLFNENLAFNISLNREGISEEKIRQAAEYVHANEFIDQIPEKLDYKIIENGKNLSAGQAQLISFARAIVGKSELMLMDEATSSVDSVTEDLIQKAIKKIFNDKTVIAVAHRLSTIRNSNQILVIKEGQIVERGDHESLQKMNGHYVKLLNSMRADTE
ncbi:ABC transporter ATP-binding protein/permease [bacterium]|nr:ABC transporter ATP-binding protein/permease [bacterium]